MPHPADLVIDTQVMVGKSGERLIVKYAELLQAVGDHPTCNLVIDKVGIPGEYDRRCHDPASAARQLLIKLSREGRLRFPKCNVQVWNPVRVALGGVRFHGNDQKFVRATMASESKILVAEEAIYQLPAVQRVLRQQAKIRVLTAEEAIELFCEPPADIVV